MTEFCPECGAIWSEEDNCTARFQRFMALEMTDSAYWAVHHLTVAAYMLQHPRQLSLRGWQEMRNLLKRCVVEGVSPAAIRAQNRKIMDSVKREWSLKKGPRLQLPADFSWTLTILSVDDSTSEQYRQDIERWARQALEEALQIEVSVR